MQDMVPSPQYQHMLVIGFQDAPPSASTTEIIVEESDADGGGAPGGASPMLDIIWLIIPIFGVMILFSIFSQRKDRKRKQEMLNSIQKHDQVQTIGGIIGSVVELKPDTVVIKVDEASNTRMTFARTAVQQVIPDTKD